MALSNRVAASSFSSDSNCEDESSSKLRNASCPLQLNLNLDKNSIQKGKRSTLEQRDLLGGGMHRESSENGMGITEMGKNRVQSDSTNGFIERAAKTNIGNSTKLPSDTSTHDFESGSDHPENESADYHESEEEDEEPDDDEEEDQESGVEEGCTNSNSSSSSFNNSTGRTNSDKTLAASTPVFTKPVFEKNSELKLKKEPDEVNTTANIDEEEDEDEEEEEEEDEEEEEEEEVDDEEEDASAFVDANASILEPTCELAESDDYDQGGYKISHSPTASLLSAWNSDDPNESRFNLRKRNSIQTSHDDFASDEDYDPQAEELKPKKLRFNFAKKNYRRQRPYTNEQVKEAVKIVLSKKMSILEASRQFDIPRTSLHNFVRLYKRGRRMGIRTISPGLTKQEEEEMVSLVIKLSRCGKRYSHNELRFLIQYYLINNDRPVFKSGTLPTMGWIAGLVERQPELVKAKSKKNTKVAVEDVEEWQRQIEDYLVNDWDLDIEDIFRHENGHRIYCFNAFKMMINGPAENAENKPAVKKEPGLEDMKDHEVSAILGMSADGGFVLPLIVFNEEIRHLCIPPESNPKGLKMFFNKTGRVDEEVALQVVKEFDEEIMLKGIPKPVVFFVNDKQDLAHFSVIEYCWENQIVIICLPPKTCKTMTPFEVSIWPKIRSSYGMLWKSAPKFFGDKISVEQFPDLFLRAWESAAVSKQAVRGFTKSGLIPLDVPAILGDAPPSLDPGEDPPKPQIPVREAEESMPDELSALEERSRGKLEGIQMCLEAIEAFIPPDIAPVWNERGADYRGRCELGFKLWRSVSLLLKAGCAMASIQQMADKFFNPFGSDFSSTASFFQKTPLVNSSPIFADMKPDSSPTAPPPIVPPTNDKPTPKKRKLNKSIYSNSAASLNNNANSEGATKADAPLVKLYQNPFTLQAGGLPMEEEE